MMERDEFLDFIRYYPLVERLCGYETPVLTEFEYARIYNKEKKEWIKVPGNTLIIMFSATNSFFINSPLNGLTEFKYNYDGNSKCHMKVLLKFLDREIKSLIKVKNNELKLLGNYETVISVMSYIKNKENLYNEMDNKINHLLFA